MSGEIVLAEAYEDGAKVKPTSFLGNRFDAYREAVSRCGATYVGSLKANVISIDRLGALRNALEEAGFKLAVSDDLRKSLEAAAERAVHIVERGKVRLQEAEEMLAKSGLSLFAYQRDGVRWLAPRQRACLFDEMGLGKTIQVLAALPRDAAVLVIAPAAVATNWVKECKKWRPDLEPSFRSGRDNFRWPMQGEMVVTTYGSIPKPDQEILLPPGEVVVVADEAHMLKGSPKRTLRVKCWNVLRDIVDEIGGRIWLLTGTPLLNRPMELWRVLSAANLAKEAFGSYPRFKELLGGRRGDYGMKWDGGVNDEAPLALQRVALRRELETVLPDLPKKRRQMDSVEIADDEAIRACDELVKTLAKHGENVDALADMGRLANEVRQVVFEMLSRVRAALAAAKIPALLERVKEYEDEELPVVVFSAHVKPLHALAARDGWGLIDGSISPDERGELVDAFQRGELKGIACSFAAGGVGITLTHAHHVMCVDLPWTPALLQQAEDRCRRIGQEHDSVHVRILAAEHPVDERVAELIVEKAELIERSVKASAVEEVAVDESISKDAEALAAMAKETSEVAESLRQEEERKRRERNERKQMQKDWRQGEFKVGQVSDNGKFRGPKNEREAFAAGALVKLAQADTDRATVVNGVGFSKFDNDFGHSLADNLMRYGRLSGPQWAHAVKLAHRYRRQTGELPESSNGNGSGHHNGQPRLRFKSSQGEVVYEEASK